MFNIFEINALQKIELIVPRNMATPTNKTLKFKNFLCKPKAGLNGINRLENHWNKPILAIILSI